MEEFICPECGSRKAGGGRLIQREFKRDDAWSAVLSVLVCADCGSHIPKHLACRWNGATVSEARKKWREVYRARR